MTWLIRALTTSAVNKTAKKRNRQQNKQIQFILYGINSIFKFKRPSDIVRLQSDKTLTTQISFFLIRKQMELFFNETR